MKVQWCWRCKADVPMLDEREYAEAAEAIDRMKDAIRAAHRERRRSEDVAEVKELPQILEGIVGVPLDAKVLLSHINHHRISKCGPPCPRCHRVLRTPTAHKCFECGCIVGEPSRNEPAPVGARPEFVRKEWLTRRTSREAATKRYPILADERVREFWALMMEGDELWYFDTPQIMWAGRVGRKGVAIIRDGEPVAHFSVIIN